MVGKYSVKNQLAYFMEWEPDIAVIIRLSSRRKYYTTKRFLAKFWLKSQQQINKEILHNTKNLFLTLFWLKWQKLMYKKILHNTKNFFF